MANTTKTFLDLIQEYSIKIPLIQRDYAQGRISEESKAIKFLEAIKSGCNEKLNLDFVYGQTNTKHSEFIPLDGQQRLTTLFLLHWYLSLENEYLEVLKKFTYEVRSSSTDFIKALTDEKNCKEYKKSNIKQQIENSNWFFLSWKNDPTVVSILNMLNLIEKYFFEETLEKLNNITFEVLYLDEFNLSDELYVKMNARGKPLSTFENFKAEFERYIDFSDNNQEEVAKNKAKMDNNWLNIFWDLSKKLVNEENKHLSEAPKLADQMFYNFFYNMTFNFFLEAQPRGTKVLTIKNQEFNIISDKKSREGFIQKCSIFDFYKNVYGTEKYINTVKVKEIVTLLDTLKEDVIFKSFIRELDISQWDRARFYAWSLGYIYKLDEIEFNRWKRVSFNLINNQLIQSPEDLIRTIHSLRSLIELLVTKTTSKDIYELIQNRPDNIDYFTKIQREEESLKAHLILEDLTWENEIIDAENNWYLEGQIGFLLEFSNNSSDKFKEYRNKFNTLWEFARNNQNKDNEQLKHQQILIYQALLTKGNYLPPLGSNYTFCSFDATSPRQRNDNWRKVFNSDKLRATEDNTQRKEYLRQLLDDSNFNISDVKLSLETIISNSQVNDFRKYFIENYLYIKYCEKLQLRYINENKIYLLKTTQMNGAHTELYTWNLFNKEFGLASKRKEWWRLESDKVFAPFETTWYKESISWDLPCIVLSDFTFEDQSIILSIIYKDESYSISVENEEKEPFKTRISGVLKELGFSNDNMRNEIAYSEILSEIEKVCTRLNGLA